MKKLVIKVCEILFFVIGFAILFSINAKAYIDPSVMTYTIQAVAGVAIAIGAAIAVYWRSVRKKLNKKLGVDENKNKEVEKDEIVFAKKKEEVKVNHSTKL